MTRESVNVLNQPLLEGQIEAATESTAITVFYRPEQAQSRCRDNSKIATLFVLSGGFLTLGIHLLKQGDKWGALVPLILAKMFLTNALCKVNRLPTPLEMLAPYIAGP